MLETRVYWQLNDDRAEAARCCDAIQRDCGAQQFRVFMLVNLLSYIRICLL